MLDRVTLMRLLCVALVATFMLPLGQALFPYVSHELTGIQFQAIEAVVDVLPPLVRSICTSLRGLSNVSVALLGPAPLKLTLFELKPAKGPDRNQAPLPQSISPVGY